MHRPRSARYTVARRRTARIRIRLLPIRCATAAGEPLGGTRLTRDRFLSFFFSFFFRDLYSLREILENFSGRGKGFLGSWIETCWFYLEEFFTPWGKFWRTSWIMDRELLILLVRRILYSLREILENFLKVVVKFYWI